jgi:hypothetical protein
MAKRPAILTQDTTFFHPTEPPRRFLQGDQDPGDAWSLTEGGHATTNGSATEVLKDLIAAHDQIEQLQRQIATRDHDLSQMAADLQAERDRNQGLEQDAIAAKALAAEANEALAAANASSTRAIQEAEGLLADNVSLRAKLAAFDGDGDGEPGGAASSPEKDELIAQLTELKADFDGRWGVTRLRKALDAATAPKA